MRDTELLNYLITKLDIKVVKYTCKNGNVVYRIMPGWDIISKAKYEELKEVLPYKESTYSEIYKKAQVRNR